MHWIGLARAHARTYNIHSLSYLRKVTQRKLVITREELEVNETETEAELTELRQVAMARQNLSEQYVA